jgi:hypothetical protein
MTINYFLIIMHLICIRYLSLIITPKLKYNTHLCPFKIYLFIFKIVQDSRLKHFPSSSSWPLYISLGDKYYLEETFPIHIFAPSHCTDTQEIVSQPHGRTALKGFLMLSSCLLHIRSVTFSK